MKRIFFFGFLSLAFQGFSQDKTKWHKSNRCDANYTFEAIENNVEGLCYVRFIVDSQRKIRIDSTKVIRGIGYGLDEIAVEVVNKNFRKSPGNEGDFIFTVPIRFNSTKASSCEMSDYFVYRGNICLSKNDSISAIDNYIKAYDLDNYNLEALKQLSLIRFMLGKDLSEAQSGWRKLYRKGYISEPEFKGRSNY